MCSAPKVSQPKSTVVTPLEAAKAITVPNTDKVPAGLDALRIAGLKKS